MTTPLPGERLVLTYGATPSPRSTAFLASSPAPSITEGLEVLVQLVMAAMTTEPVAIRGQDHVKRDQQLITSAACFNCTIMSQ